jgi:peptidyl-prolyl cis-trans isomerase D
MLQSIRDKSSGWIAKLILLAIILVMAMFGLQQTLSPSMQIYAAKVTVPGKFMGFGEKTEEISVDDFRRRFDLTRQQQRQQQGEAFNAEAFEKPENKRKVLEQMVDEAVMRLGAQQAGITVSDAMVQEAILKIPAFQVDGKFDKSSYLLTLQGQGYTPSLFENMMRQDLLTRFMVTEFINSGYASAAEGDALIKLSDQKRNISYIEVPLPALNYDVSDADLKKWYDGHKGNYRTEETVTIEYVELDQSAAQADLIVDESVLRQRYEEQKAQFGTPEQRVASHILVAVAEGADAAADAAAKAKATALAKQAQANPASFAQLAASSDDLASRDAGGDLGPIEKGIFGDAFDAAFFALNPGQISDPVRLPDGWHILYYRELIAGTVRPFEEVRAEIEETYLASEKERTFNETASKMVDAASENATSLEPSAKAAGRPLLRTAAFTRRTGEGIAAIDPVRKAAFSDDVLKERRVSDLIEIEPNHVVLLRVVDHQPESILPLDQVKDQVRQAVALDRAGKIAESEAKAVLARLEKGETLQQVSESLSRPIVPVMGITRQTPVPQLQPVVAEAFRLAKPVQGKPGGSGLSVMPDGGYIVMQLDGIVEPDLALVDPAARSAAARNLGQIRGDQQSLEYIKSLRKSMEIDIAEDRL